VYVVIGIVALGVLATAISVYAQPPAGGAPGGAPGGGFGGPGGGRGGFMGMMMGGGPAIAVAGDSVYVVYMGTLFKFNADTLEEIAQVQLKPEALANLRPPGGGAPGAVAPVGPPGGAPQ